MIKKPNKNYQNIKNLNLSPSLLLLLLNIYIINNIITTKQYALH